MRKSTISFCFFIFYCAANAYAVIGRAELVTHTLAHYLSVEPIEEKVFTQQEIDSARQRYTALTLQEIDKRAITPLPRKEKFSARKEGVWINRTKAFLKDIHPYVKVKTQHDSNLYLVHSDPKEDVTTTISAGLETTKKIGKRLAIILNGGDEIIKYASQTQYNTDYPYANGLFKVNLGKLKLAFAAGIDKERSPASLAEDLDVKKMIDSWVYTNGASFKFNFRRLETQLQHDHKTSTYIDGDLTGSNSSRDILGIRNAYKIFPRTRIFLGYARGWFDYFKSTSGNWTYDRYWLGLDSRFLYKFSGELKYGYVATNHKVGRHETGNTFSSRLSYKPNRQLDFFTQVINGLGESDLIVDSIVKNKGASFGVGYMPFFSKKLRLQAVVTYKEEDLEPSTRQKYLSAAFKPQYKLTKGVMLGLKYEYAERRSNIETDEYIDRSIAFTLDSEF